MKAEQLLREMTEIDDKYVTEANPEEKQKKPRHWGVVAVAAGLALAVGVGVFALTRPSNNAQLTAPGDDTISLEKPSDPTEITPTGVEPTEAAPDTECPTGINPNLLPTVIVPDYQPGSAGYEGYLAWDIRELANGNPWRANSSPIYLPVYTNLAYSPIGFSQGLGEDAAMTKFAWITDALELPTFKDAEVCYEPPYEGAKEVFSYLKAEGNGLRLFVWANGSVELFFEPDCPLLPQIAFPQEGESLPETGAQAIMQALIETYAAPLGLENPRSALFGDYSFSGERQYTFSMYDAGKSSEDAILNFAFRRVQFGCSEGKLRLIRISDSLSAAEKMGDYPIINPERAEALLREGHYQTSVPHALTADDSIVKVELVYRSGASELEYLPYYRFYVDLTDVQEDGGGFANESGLHSFGAYYVPAVEPGFVETMPTYNGSFN